MALFWMLGPIMVIAAFGLLVARKAVHAALCMALVMICLGVVYVAQEAPFLGVVQVFVYTGAVMMLFLFVLMLVGRRLQPTRWSRPSRASGRWPSCSGSASPCC